MRIQTSLKDQIECRYTTIQIGQMYAKFLAGRGKFTNLRDIARKYKQEAGVVDINQAVEALASDWKRFSKTTCS